MNREEAQKKLRELMDGVPEPTGFLAVGYLPYSLFIDDERDPPDPTWVVVRTVDEAKAVIERDGLPTRMSLDHDLGGDETVMQVLHWMAEEYYSEGPPEWVIHSANPVGRENMASFLGSWEKSLGR